MSTRTAENMAPFATSLLSNLKAFRGRDAPPRECADRRSSLRGQRCSDGLSREFSDPAAVKGITLALIGDPILSKNCQTSRPYSLRLVTVSNRLQQTAALA